MNTLKPITLFCARAMPNMIMAVTAVVLFCLLGVTILISIMFDEWREEASRKPKLSLWENPDPEMLSNEHALQAVGSSTASGQGV